MGGCPYSRIYLMFEIEPKQLIYNRTGNLSQTTVLNREIAEKFMRVSDLRFNVAILDSDKRPERATAVSVGSDILAWRSIVPFSELTKVILRPKKFHQTEISNGQYRILVHDRIIDADIQKTGFQDREEYESRYLARLRREVKEGLAETIWREKLGLRDQLPNWLPYFMFLAQLPSTDGNPVVIGSFAGTLIFIIHPMLAFLSYAAIKRHQRLSEFIPGFRLSVIHPSINPRSWKTALLPAVPVDKWIRGRAFLAQQGDNLITAKS